MSPTRQNGKIGKGCVYICNNSKCSKVHVRLQSGGTKTLEEMKKDDWSQEAINEAGAFLLNNVNVLAKKFELESRSEIVRARKVELDSGELKAINMMKKEDWSGKALHELAWRLQENVSLIAKIVVDMHENANAAELGAIAKGDKHTRF